jgi:hypothetical protein
VNAVQLIKLYSLHSYRKAYSIVMAGTTREYIPNYDNKLKNS